MSKYILGLSILVVLFGYFTNNVSASLLVIEPDGNVQVNVLSAETQNMLAVPKMSDLQINKVGDTQAENTSLVKLAKADNKISLDIYGSSGTRSLNVTDFKESLIEIEQRQDIQKLTIAIVGEKFSLQDKGTMALTTLPITVDSKTANLSISTNSGDKRLSVFPFDAVQTALRTKFLSTVNTSGVEIIDEEDKLQYKIQGEKVINLFNIYNYSIPISSYISAATGEVLRVDAPGWLKIINVLFS